MGAYGKQWGVLRITKKSAIDEDTTRLHTKIYK
jgi:hypothetical protein